MGGEVANENNGKSTRESKKASKQAAVASPGACACVAWSCPLQSEAAKNCSCLLSRISSRSSRKRAGSRWGKVKLLAESNGYIVDACSGYYFSRVQDEGQVAAWDAAGGKECVVLRVRGFLLLDRVSSPGRGGERSCWLQWWRCVTEWVCRLRRKSQPSLLDSYTPLALAPRTGRREVSDSATPSLCVGGFGVRVINQLQWVLPTPSRSIVSLARLSSEQNGQEGMT